ncbi:MAG: o-succinylbenzoate synthase [Victivallaceae bacterium]|nr:o-succinylbenzoate synthase [Victivallaceae bacterium]
MTFSIDSAVLYPFSIPLKMPFRISAGEIRKKNGLILEIKYGDLCGWGEASVDKVPFYAHETVGSVMDLLTNSLLPLVKGKKFEHPDEVSMLMEHFRGNNFAKAAIDAAVWDLYGKMLGQPCWRLLGGTRSEVEVGPSLGIKKEPAILADAVEAQLAQGFRRIKIKVAPGLDTEYINLVRCRFPEISLMVDANNAYGIDDFDRIATWDRFHLLMIEQPLDEHDIYFHSLLRNKVKNPICLDESIHTLHDARCSAAIGSADIINIKVCRVGGLTNARKIHDFCRENGIANWIGSRVGSGVAEAARLAAATLPNCTLPSDCVISSMYMADDILAEPLAIRGGMVKAPEKPGLGIEINREKLAKYAPEPFTV